jgi:hypothetical protein
VGRSRRPAVAAAIAVLVLVAAGVVIHARSDSAAALTRSRGRLVVECHASHSAPDDPIVFPGQPGLSHMHDFFGAAEVDAFSTAESLEGGPTTCEIKQDRASYWAPALYHDGEKIDPASSDAYYRAAPGVDHTTVQSLPYGLKIVAGDASARAPQSTDIVGWGCGRNPRLTAAPAQCSERAELRLHVVFPDCWDGVHLDAADHMSHMSYSTGGRCDDDHPVPVAQLEFIVQYPFWDDPSSLVLASGSPYTAHADFFNTWEPDALEHEINACVRGNIICGVPSL